MQINSFLEGFSEFKNNLFNSKRYWVIYLILVLIYSIFIFFSENYFDVKSIVFIFLLSFLGIFFISFFYMYNDSARLYVFVFFFILICGIVFSFLTPVMFVPDEVEHFVRAEMISRGVLFPEYNETPFLYEGTLQKGSYLTIQSTLDLIKYFKSTTSFGYDYFYFSNVFSTNLINTPLDYNLVQYHSAFSHNPFFGYIVPALGILLAKSLNLNVIWLLWVGRVFNAILYAFLVALSIKKTPIFKVPLLVIACIPLSLMQASSFSIDSLINGLGLFSIAYFFKMCYFDNFDYKVILKFSLIVLVLGLCKITYFSFILLLLFVPMNNFKEKKYYFIGILSIFILTIILLFWSKFYVNPNISNSYRFIYFKQNNIQPLGQLNYILSCKQETLFVFFGQFIFSLFTFDFALELNSIFLLFFGLLCLLYPESKLNLKSRIGALIIFVILYWGTMFVMLLDWTPLGCLFIKGFQSRYIFPALGLIPFSFGNYIKINKFILDLFIICVMFSFISFDLIKLIIIY